MKKISTIGAIALVAAMAFAACTKNNSSNPVPNKLGTGSFLKKDTITPSHLAPAINSRDTVTPPKKSFNSIIKRDTVTPPRTIINIALRDTVTPPKTTINIALRDTVTPPKTTIK